MGAVIKIAASGLGAGYVPVAPGTAGAVVGLGLCWVLSSLNHHVYIPTVVAFVFLSAWISSRASILYEAPDPQKITIDEIAGILVTFIFHQLTWISAIAGFILFRLFDIAKPFPVRWVERRFPGGWGIVLDDVVAGVYANAALWIVLMVLGKLGIEA